MEPSTGVGPVGRSSGGESWGTGWQYLKTFGNIQRPHHFGGGPRHSHRQNRLQPRISIAAHQQGSGPPQQRQLTC